MRSLFSNLAVFVVLALSFSALTGCGGSGAEPAANAANAANTKVSNPSSRSSEYPPLAELIATSTMKNLDGSPTTVREREGKIVLLNLWATWCGPCRAEMPTLVKMQDQYRDQGFEVLGLNTDDEPKDKIDAFAAEMKLNYPIVWADTKMQNELLKISKYTGIPQSFLIDREGHLRAVIRGASPKEIATMEKSIADLVAE